MFELFFLSSFIGLSIFGLILFAIITCLVETDRPGFATLFVLGVLGALEYFSPIKPFTFMFDNPLLSLGFIATYVALGVVWATAKWWFLVVKIKNLIVDAMMHIKHPSNTSGYNGRQALINALPAKYQYIMDSKTLRPQISKSKFRYMVWMVYWPFSFVWTMINDPVRKLFNWIFNKLKNTLQSISDRVFKDVNIPGD